MFNIKLKMLLLVMINKAAWEDEKMILTILCKQTYKIVKT